MSCLSFLHDLFSSLRESEEISAVQNYSFLSLQLCNNLQRMIHKISVALWLFVSKVLLGSVLQYPGASGPCSICYCPIQLPLVQFCSRLRALSLAH